jgi:hypothetical protein
MTIAEMYNMFDLAVDKVSSSAVADITMFQKDFLFNNACRNFVKQRYGDNNNSARGFEDIQKRVDDLSSLVMNADLPLLGLGFHSTGDNPSKIYAIPDDYWFSVTEVAQINTECGILTSMVVQGRHSEIYPRLRNSFHRPKDEKVFRVMHANGTTDNSNNVIEVFHDKSSTILKYLLVYIAEPKKLRGVSPENLQSIQDNPTIRPLPSYHFFPTTGNIIVNGVSLESWLVLEYWMNKETHEEIVDIAVKMALDAIESPRLQSQYINLQKQE